MCLAVEELEVAPRVERPAIGQQVADVLQPFTLVSELGEADLVPAVAVGSMCSSSSPSATATGAVILSRGSEPCRPLVPGFRTAYS